MFTLNVVSPLKLRVRQHFGIALVTTDRAATTEQVTERYVSSWAIEVAIEDAKQTLGTGQARNGTAAAVERTVPFEFACQAIAVTWYATVGHDPADLHERRALSLVQQQDRAGYRRHGRQAPPRHHRSQI